MSQTQPYNGKMMFDDVGEFSDSNNSTNKFHMMHGKGYNEWQPQAHLNNKIRQDAKIMSNWEYRTYLQNNADYIRSYNSLEAYNATGVSPFFDNRSPNQPKISNSPFIFGSLYNEATPSIGYNDSDLKQDFLKKERQQCRMIAPSISLSNIRSKQ